jgi:GntR family transcriptional regulator / MocR family aminotransferase
LYFSIDRHSNVSLQEQLRSKIVAAILAGQLAPGGLLPSTRALSKKLKISRTTVVLVFEKLAEDGFLVAQDRSGFRVNPETRPISLPVEGPKDENVTKVNAVAWEWRFKQFPSQQRNINKPINWQSYRYPFVYGQPDTSLFPLAAWRECSRQAMSEMAMRDWSSDAIVQDDPNLVREIQTKLLPARGVFAQEDEILITAGAQNALYLISSLLMNADVTVGVEEPGYPDARNIFALKNAKLQPMSVDEEGACLPPEDTPCQYLFITPSHQSPTTVTMSPIRRRAFLQYAEDQNAILIEDDFESETNYQGAHVSAIKADDKNGRVIYVGSLSKSMFPGLRLGYVVADKSLISELRSLRRLILRHTPSNNQRTTSLFIGQGLHDSYVRKLNRTYKERWQLMQSSLQTYLPGMSVSPTFGGTSFWLRGPDGLDSRLLAKQALERQVVIEPGTTHFMQPSDNREFFRLGFSSIPTDRIHEGVKILADLLLD